MNAWLPNSAASHSAGSSPWGSPFECTALRLYHTSEILLPVISEHHQFLILLLLLSSLPGRLLPLTLGIPKCHVYFPQRLHFIRLISSHCYHLIPYNLQTLISNLLVFWAPDTHVQLPVEQLCLNSLARSLKQTDRNAEIIKSTGFRGWRRRTGS